MQRRQQLEEQQQRQRLIEDAIMKNYEKLMLDLVQKHKEEKKELEDQVKLYKSLVLEQSQFIQDLRGKTFQCLSKIQDTLDQILIVKQEKQ